MLNYFNDFLGLSGWENTTNIYEEPEFYEAEVRATGIKKEDINIKFNSTGDVLIISGKPREVKKDVNRRWISHEFWPSKIDTSLALTDDIDTLNITAKVEDGILRIRLPKKKSKVIPEEKRVIMIE